MSSNLTNYTKIILFLHCCDLDENLRKLNKIKLLIKCKILILMNFINNYCNSNNLVKKFIIHDLLAYFYKIFQWEIKKFVQYVMN